MTRRLTALFGGSLAILAIFVLTVGCGSDEELPGDPPEMQIGEKRTQTLRYLRFDVTNFTTTYTKEDLLELPTGIRESLWLFDLDLSNGENSPRLLDYSLRQIKDLAPETLDPAARNMQRLLNMTPDNAVLVGTSFEEIALLAPVIGIPSAKILADLLEVNVEAEFLSTTAVASTILANVIGSHPNAQLRAGPVTPENPDGLYPVTPGSLPVTLADAAADFATLSAKFGPVYVGGVYHPGFIDGDVEAHVLEDDFAMTIRANANALPYKGLDLTNSSTASVNSVASQIEDLFDLDDPNFLTIQGLTPGAPTIATMRFKIVEADGFIEGGTSPFPESYGDSAGWQLPPWTIERILLDAARTSHKDTNSSVIYYLPDSDEPAVDAMIEDGWTTIATAGGLGSPPRPQYIWDILLEVAQVRLHDGPNGGQAIPEGEANVSFELNDVPVGLSATEIEARIRDNIRNNPTALLDIASNLLDSTRGDADFYYYRPGDSAPSEVQGDYLYFVNVSDIGLDDEGNPTREYTYANPGFYADAALTQKVSSKAAIEGDVTHEKVRIQEGDVLFSEDDDGRVFRLAVGPKPSRGTIFLEIERVR